MEEFKSINDILDFAINSEQEAVEFYTTLASSLKNEEMREVFLQFAQEEMGHKARLVRIKEQGSFSISPEKIQDLKIADYLVDVEPTSDMSYRDALVLAMQKEKGAFRLYTNLAAKAQTDDVRELFLSLAQEESKHKLRFEIEYDDFVMREN